MALREFDNMAVLDGTLNDVPFEGTESTIATVALSSIQFAKEANQDIWLNGELEYKLTITNAPDEGVLKNIVITDTLDITVFSLDLDSFEIINNGITLLDTQYTIAYVAATGALTITITDTNVELAPNQVMTVTFRGSKVTP